MDKIRPLKSNKAGRALNGITNLKKNLFFDLQIINHDGDIHVKLSC